MSILRRLLHTPRALGALLLLATLVTGEVADARHHLAREGCATEEHGARKSDCACAALHAVALGIDLAADLSPVVSTESVAPIADAITRHEHRGAEAAPRAPPRD